MPYGYPESFGSTRQRGQAMAEFIAVAGVFIFMLLAIPWLAKLGDIRQNTEQAARHAAWERTVWLTAAQKPDKGAVLLDEAHLQENVVHHFFTGRVERNEFAEGNMLPQQGYWHEPGGQPMIDNIADIKVSTSNGAMPGVVFRNTLAQLSDATTLLGTEVSGATGNGAIFSLDENGLYRSEVSASVNDRLGGKLAFTGNVSLLANEWYGGGRKRTEKKVQGLVATAAMNTSGMQNFVTMTRQIDQVFRIFGYDPVLEFGLIFGKATDDGMPDDRKEMVRKWDIARFPDGLDGPHPSEKYKDFAVYKYVPSAAAVAAMPLNLGVIDPNNSITQNLP